MIKKNVRIIILVAIMFIANVTTAFAANNNLDEEISVSRERIINEVSNQEMISLQSNWLPNELKIDFVATATSITVIYKNRGIDAIDFVKSTVTIGNNKKNISIVKLKPGTTRKTVYINMKKCKENISVYTIAREGKSSLGTSNTTGSREIPSNLLNQWHKGSFFTVEASLNYHFKEHGKQVKKSDIVSYVESAIQFRYNLRGATKSKVPGKTPNVTRWRKNGRYIDLYGSKNTGKIISYGR